MIRRTIYIGTILSSVALTANAQSIKLRLLNGKTGKPMRNQTVTVAWVAPLESVDVWIGVDGTGTVTAPKEAETFGMLSGTEAGSNKIAFLNCNAGASHYYLSEVYTVGVVPRNTCGKATAPARRGEIIFWALPRPFWDFQ